MRWFQGFLAAASLTLTLQAAPAQESKALPRATPESQGVSSEAVREFIATLDQKVTTMHSVMVVRHGKVIAEAWWQPQTPETPHVLWRFDGGFHPRFRTRWRASSTRESRSRPGRECTRALGRQYSRASLRTLTTQDWRWRRTAPRVARQITNAVLNALWMIGVDTLHEGLALAAHVPHQRPSCEADAGTHRSFAGPDARCAHVRPGNGHVHAG